MTATGSSSNSGSEGSDSVNEAVPRPVSSDGSSDDDTSSDHSKDAPSKEYSSSDASDEELVDIKSKTTKKAAVGGISRLFAPYRTVGVVSSGAPFHLIPHQSSASAMICVPIKDRFQLMRTDRLDPVMVSRSVQGTIRHCVTDPTLSVTVVSHGKAALTLFQRVAPQQTMVLGRSRTTNKNNSTKEKNHSSGSSTWKIVDLLTMGRTKINMTGEKEGTMENATILVALMNRGRAESQIVSGGNQKVSVVGDSDGDSSDDEDDFSSNDDNSDDDDDDECSGQAVVLIATRTGLRIQKRIKLTSMPLFFPTVVMHPATYLNKVVVGGSDQKSGKPSVCLLNIRSGKVIHVFQSIPSKSGNTVTTMEQSPAVDTIAIGTDTGSIHLFNLRLDRVLFTLVQKGKDGRKVSIDSISFRTDSSALQYNISPMAVGRSDGTITVWNLTASEESHGRREILCEIDRAHEGGVSKLQYLPNEALLISTGRRSNAVLMHIFENPDHSARILRFRRGHSAPPKHIQYLHPGAGMAGGVLVNSGDGTDAAACQILSSGGQDRTLRIFSTARSVLDKEYSQGRGLEKKAKKFALDSVAELRLPPVIGVALCETRSRDWGDLVTIHENHAFGYVWSTRKGSQSGPVLRQSSWNVSSMKKGPSPMEHATSVTLSVCGNFAYIGTVGGKIYKYNMQSGIPRGSFPPSDDGSEAELAARAKNPGNIRRTAKALEKAAKINYKASNKDKQEQLDVKDARMDKRMKGFLSRSSHEGFPVTGLGMDAMNTTLISVGADAKVIQWKTSSHFPQKKAPFTLPSPAVLLHLLSDSGLAAIALEDASTILFDYAAGHVVRRFGAGEERHSGRISDILSSPDGRTLFTSSYDGTIRVWDIPTNSCVDWLGFRSPPTSMSMSPTGEFLATTHLGDVGISLWSDRSYLQAVQLRRSGLRKPFAMDDPLPLLENTGPSTRQAVSSGGNLEDLQDSINSDWPEWEEATALKNDGLIKLSNLPAAHWKNLFHLDLVKERNKPIEPPKKPPSAPFFLQWRGGESIEDPAKAVTPLSEEKEDAHDWEAAWTEDSEDETGEDWGEVEGGKQSEKRKLASADAAEEKPKRPKIVHHRSPLAQWLVECDSGDSASGAKFQAVTEKLSRMGPSAIDLAFSSLCHGMHDLTEGGKLLELACLWLIEACASRDKFEVVNAYLHRFLFIHAEIVGSIQGSTTEEGIQHRDTADNLRRVISRLHMEQADVASEVGDKMAEATGLLGQLDSHGVSGVVDQRYCVGTQIVYDNMPIFLRT